MKLKRLFVYLPTDLADPHFPSQFRPHGVYGSWPPGYRQFKKPSNASLY